jgi:subtilisin family serine protease
MVGLVAMLGAAPSGAAPEPASGSVAAGQSSSAGGAGDDARPTDVLPAGGSWTVTLLTGEVVDVSADADGRVSAHLRESTGPVSTLRLPTGELYVIPRAVQPLLDRVIDRSLYDVTNLVRQGLDDDSSDVLPVIVQRPAGVDSRSALGLERGTEARSLPSIGGTAVAVPKDRTAATGTEVRREVAVAEAADTPPPVASILDGVTKVWLDNRVEVSAADPAAVPAQAAPLDPNLEAIGADDAWAEGLTGEGVTVAVLDTGIDATHPDLAGQVVAQENFSDAEDTVDRHGHGTHVASLVAGTGAGSDGARRGVAPDADLVIGRVLDDFGFGWDSQVIAGMEWAAPQAPVVNMSVGDPFGFPGGPVDQALDALTEAHGTLFVVAAGNSGPDDQTIESPGSAGAALTVGAVDASDVVADFSSRGPEQDTFGIEPELAAPGVDIVAARAAGTSMGDPVDEAYTAASGTSMATPQVAGAAAVLAGQHPDWTGNDIRSVLVGSTDAAGEPYDVGSGRLAVDTAIDATVHSERDVVELSLDFPHDTVHREPLSWTNTGTTSRTISFAATLEDRGGDAVDGAVSFASDEVTVAPGATAEVDLAVDGAALDDGIHAGAITATVEAAGADVPAETIRVPLSVVAEPETVELTLSSTAPGGPVAEGSVPMTMFGVVNLDDYALFHLYGIMGGEWGPNEWTIEVPVGRYAILGEVTPGDPDTVVTALAGDPEIVIDEDTDFVFDGAAAVPLSPRVTGIDTAPPGYVAAAIVVEPGGAGGSLGFETYSWYPEPPVRVTPFDPDDGAFGFRTIYRLQREHLTAEVGGDALDIRQPDSPTQLEAGERTLEAVDAGDGSDFAGASGKLAVVRMPIDPAERQAVTQRAFDAGVAVLAFVDPARDYLTPDGWGFTRWAEIPVISGAGEAGDRLIAAGAAGEEVTITVSGSPYVYDIVNPWTDTVDPEPVISRRAQRSLARIDERFHRDPSGAGSQMDRRYPVSESLMNLDSLGPLRQRRTAYVTPGITWQSMAIGDVPQAWIGGELVSVALSQDAGRVFEPGSRSTLRWLRPPMRPGPVGGPEGASGCQPTPVTRTGNLLQVWLSPFMDEPDRYGCADPDTAQLSLERDGLEIASYENYYGEFELPAEAGDYRLVYEQTADDIPYGHHESTTAWSFSSAGPAGGSEDEQLIPLLVVDYELPLDTLNRPTGRTARFKVHQVTGTPNEAVRSFRVWTSTDGGATWRRASTDRDGNRTWDVTLPRVADGTSVSLKVDARDADGNRIEQTLVDAYTG